LAASEGEKPMRQRRRAQRRCRRRIHEVRDVIQPLGSQAPAHQIERADDAGQGVVEVVSDAAREVADRVHFLLLPKSLMCRSQIRLRRLSAVMSRPVQ
jgi:hypothetical protein